MKFSLTSFAAVAAASLLIAPGFAQELDVDTEIEQSENTQTEMTIVAGDALGGSPMIFSTSESIGPGGISSGMRIMSASPGGMAFLGGDADFTMPAPDPWSMLNNPSVQKDLELVGDQLKKVQDLQASFGQQMKDQIGDFSKGGFTPDKINGLKDLVANLRAEQKSQMEGLLLPHQIERLKQVALQTHMQQSGTAGALASDKVAEALGIDDKQKETLKERSKELSEKLQQDIAALKEKAKDDLLMVLTPAQRTKLKEMTGDKFESKTEDWKDMLKGPRKRMMRRGSNDDN